MRRNDTQMKNLQLRNLGEAYMASEWIEVEVKGKLMFSSFGNRDILLLLDASLGK